MTESRPRVGELISAGCALALLILLLATAWYGVAAVPDPTYARPAVSGTETGWEGLPVVRWVVVLTAIVAVGAVVLRISQREHGRQTDASRLVTALGLVCSALLIYRVLIVLPSPDKVLYQKLGALLGLGCALGVALGGHESIVERRSRIATISHRSGRRRTPPIPADRSGPPPSPPADRSGPPPSPPADRSGPPPASPPPTAGRPGPAPPPAGSQTAAGPRPESRAR